MKLNFFAKAKKKKPFNTRVLTHPIFLKHRMSKDHPERPERMKFILDILKNNNYLSYLENVNLDRDVEKWILKIHNKKHLSSLKKNFPLAEKVSKSAVQTCLKGIDQIMNNKAKNIFCAVRPPGHHALNTGKDEGFCYYNHVAITAKYAQEKYNLKKILIVDWDYHHGNSTEYFFYDDPTVLFFSSHDQFAYPGTGSPSRKGIGRGVGFNINVHLPCRTKDEDIIKIYQKKLVPRANEFKPDLVLVSAGFDSRINDLLGCYDITDKGFEELTKIVMKISSNYSNGRLLSVLEGGYNLLGNAKASLAHIKILDNFH
tara:strand:+ start:91 stop:1035 length:945 start_codon:yes stop_codon:yes gene_type:complete